MDASHLFQHAPTRKFRPTEFFIGDRPANILKPLGASHIFQHAPARKTRPSEIFIGDRANVLKPRKTHSVSVDAQHFTYADGSTYVGQIKDGKRHGYGFWEGRNCQYEGQWKEDQQHGEGSQTWNDGRVDDGQFSCRMFSGRGRMIWQTPTGMQVYEGSYLNDLRHGAGTFVWADRRSYDGEWVKVQRHGEGVYVDKRGDKKFGTWVNDKQSPRKSPEVVPAIPSPTTKRPHFIKALYTLGFRHFLSLCQQIVFHMALVSVLIRVGACKLLSHRLLDVFFANSLTLFRGPFHKMPSPPARTV